ncbi:MAG: hypothetical protein AAGG56_16870 [Pseudomonadota bacterium]
MESYFAAVKRDVKLSRICVLELAVSLEDNIVKIAIQDCAEGNIATYIVLKDDPRFEALEREPIDFMVFADRKVSESDIGAGAQVLAADVKIDEIEAKRFSVIYERILQYAHPFES